MEPYMLAGKGKSKTQICSDFNYCYINRLHKKIPGHPGLIYNIAKHKAVYLICKSFDFTICF